MLVLTTPGERIMDPAFGVGLRNYLFEPNEPATYEAIANKINQQVGIYLPYISIDNINFTLPENNPDLFPQSLTVSVAFTIVPLQQSDMLEITVAN